MSRTSTDAVDAEPPVKRRRLSEHESHTARLRPAIPLEPLLDPSGVAVDVGGCAGFCVLRGPQWCSDAAAVYDELGSAAADRLSWTALRDGGNPNDLSDTVKAYCGDDGMLSRGGRYKRQLLVRGRRAEALLSLPHLMGARRSVLSSVESLVGAAAEAHGEPSPAVTLLTEQLIRYLPSDRWFAPHYDKDRRDKTHAPLDPKTYDGPGDALATLCLGCACTILMLPRTGYEAAAAAAGGRPFCIELRPGDVYVLHGAARWEWLHGISVADDVETARRVVVWRVLLN